jgi:hypothetical protein
VNDGRAFEMGNIENGNGGLLFYGKCQGLASYIGGLRGRSRL